MNREYHGQFELDRFLNEEYIKDKKNGFFVECGAYDGIEESTCLFFEENLKWTGINIEPVPEIFEFLEKNRPNCINIDIPLSNKSEVKEFDHIVHPERGIWFGNGSFKHNKDHLDYLSGLGCTVKKYTMKCATFKSIWDKIFRGKSKPEIDIFVLDVEGGELEALDGILKIGKTFLPKVFCIEHSMVGFDNINNKVKEYYSFSKQYYQNSVYLRKY
jgi:hypothetical protein